MTAARHRIGRRAQRKGWEIDRGVYAAGAESPDRVANRGAGRDEGRRVLAGWRSAAAELREELTITSHDRDHDRGSG